MKLRFLDKRRETPTITTFRFVPVTPLTWIAGQSIRLELPAGWGTEERRFTVSSAPYEAVIAITTRVSASEFKLALDALVPGTEVDAYALEGDFVWDRRSVRPVFLAAGIGITPFHAMLKQRFHEGSPMEAALLYAGSGAELLFELALRNWQRGQSALRIEFLHGQRLSAELVAELVPDFVRRTMYLAGPQTMVDALSQELLAQHLPEAQLRRDWFTGW